MLACKSYFITSNIMFHSMATSGVLSLAFALLCVVSICSASRALLIVDVEPYDAQHAIAESFHGQAIGYGGSAQGGGPYGAEGEQETNNGRAATSGDSYDGNWRGFSGGSNGDHYDSGGKKNDDSYGTGGDEGFDGYGGAYWTPRGGEGGEHHSGCNGSDNDGGGEYDGSYHGGSAGGSGSYNTGETSGGGSWTGYWFSHGSKGGGGAGGSMSYGVGDNHNDQSGGSASHNATNGYENLGVGGDDGHTP